jgi:uncharacterized protein HemX
MPPTDRQHYALQTIFSFFLGLMVVAFVGVGVNTFYPSPVTQSEQAQQAISRRIDAINTANQNRSLDTTSQTELRRLQDQQNALQDKIAAAQKNWARTTSIILVIFATLVMGVSLIRSEQLKVISNGLLLGGLFTMVYGVGWVLFSGNSVARFWVIAFALLVTIGLGYVKFVRQRRVDKAGSLTLEASSDGGTLGTDDTASLEALSERVAALEKRAAAAATALGGNETDRTR